MIVKVKEPQPGGIRRSCAKGRSSTPIFISRPIPSRRSGLLKSGVTGVAYETVTDDRGGLPLLAPMSEVAGRLAIQAAAYSLTAPQGGRGLLMGGVPGVLPAKVLVIGGGVVGHASAKMAIGLGAEVTILDRESPPPRRTRRYLRRPREDALSRPSTRSMRRPTRRMSSSAPSSFRARRAPKLVTREMLKGMKQGAVLVDVSIDQGGCFETSKPTTHAEPTYVVDGVVHYCVANMPGAVPMTSSHALNNATLAFGLQLADQGPRSAQRKTSTCGTASTSIAG